MSEKSRILYVEDDETLSFVTKDNLELNGYKVDHCMDGESAVETFFHNSYDLCILDVMLPKMDGFAVAEKIRATDPNVPILFLTTESQQSRKLEAKAAGATGWIVKPATADELLSTIKLVIR